MLHCCTSDLVLDDITKHTDLFLLSLSSSLTAIYPRGKVRVTRQAGRHSPLPCDGSITKEEGGDASVASQPADQPSIHHGGKEASLGGRVSVYDVHIHDASGLSFIPLSLLLLGDVGRRELPQGMR